MQSLAVGSFLSQRFLNVSWRGSARGFSVIELLTSISLFIIALSVLTVQIPRIRDSFNRKQAFQQLEADIRLGRSEALARGARIVLKATADGSAYSIGVDRLPYDTSQAADDILYNRKLPSGISLPANQAVSFDSRGSVIDGFGQMTTLSIPLLDGGVRFLLATVYPTGSVAFSD